MAKEKQASLKKSEKISIPSQNIHLDPRSKSSIRGKSYIAQGDTVTVKGTKTRKPVKATWY